MILPFVLSVADMVLRMLTDIAALIPFGMGNTFVNYIKPYIQQTLGRYYIVDTEGMLVWTILFLGIGVIIGYTLKRTKIQG